ncbi:WD40 repeat domain-containing serine/threonine protein kinase [Rubripirellula reticaptiva]|uniref:Serine/threonine-protein kinase PknB n=1 Tax=Rubripirellula reticaptiva TaxID=2528013 RepID=A0A5C6FDL5_9BACT|nr:WD40 repeat domain-containing serine/threonine-protein kinase [Rubripirellula reticaptiva]TWU58166.1 Serine/threonine-protein kinase PknB [Rubripirellula reticaptiva]
MNDSLLDSADSRDRLAEAAKRFGNQLQAQQGADWPSEAQHSRIASVLRLLHATLSPNSTQSMSQSGGLDETFSIPKQVGRFKVGQRVGEGGFGVVYKAFDEVLRRDVALKAVPRRAGIHSASEEYRLREARASARLNHPYLVPLYEVVEDEQCVYLVSEFCNGPTLYQYLQEHPGRVSPRWAAEVTLKLGQAVAHAHGRGLVHRDIKPGNVLLSPERADGDILPFTPRLTDFGLVLEIDSDSTGQTQSGFAGTVMYMSPEQIMGDERWDARSSDVYSLGLLLYQMIAGELPFRSSKPLELLTQICTEPIKPIAVDTKPISQDLLAICYKAIHKQPSQRYESAQALVDDLLRWQDGREVTARRQSSLERTWLSARRAPVLLGLFIALVTLAITSILVFAWSNRLLRKKQAELGLAVTEASLSRKDAIEIAYRSDMNQAYLAVARQDPATAMSFVNDIKRYSGDQYHDRFDFRLLGTLARDGWTELAGLETMVEEVVPMPNANLHAIAGGNQVRFYRSDQRQPVREIQLAEGEILHALAVAPDEDFLALGISGAPSALNWLGLNNDRIQFFSLGGRKVPKPIQQFATTLESLAFSSDGKRLAAGTRYEPIQIFTIGSDSEPITVASVRRNEDLAFAPNDKIAWIAESNAIRIQKPGDKSSARSLKIPGPSCFDRMSRSSDGKQIVATVRFDSRGYLYDLDRDDKEPTVLENSHGELSTISFSPNGNYVAGGTTGGGVVVWHLGDQSNIPSKNILSKSDESQNNELPVDGKRTSIPVAMHRSIHGDRVTAIGISSDGVVISGSNRGHVTAWATQGVADVRQVISLDSQSNHADVSPDGKIAIAGYLDGSVWRVELSSGRRQQLRMPTRYLASAVKISPDGRYIAVGWLDGSLAIAKIDPSLDSTPTWLMRQPEPLPDHVIQSVNHIDFNPSSNKVCVCRGASRFELIEITDSPSPNGTVSLQPVTSFHAPTSIDSISVLDDQTIITLGDTVRIWNGKATSIPTSQAGIGYVRCQCSDIDKRWIYAGCGDGRIRKISDGGVVLSTSSRWAPIVTQPQTTRRITAITLSPDGLSVLTGSNLGDVAIWDAASLRYLGEIWQGDSAGEIQRIRVSSNESAEGGDLLFVHQREFPVLGPTNNGKLQFMRLDSSTNNTGKYSSFNLPLTMATEGGQGK